MRTPRSATNSGRPGKSGVRSHTRFGILLGAAIAAIILVVAVVGGTPLTASTSEGQQQAAKAKRYKGTRAFVVDKQSGQVRLPTAEEVDEVIANLSAYGQRAAESLAQTTQSTGAVGVDLDGAFAGVLLARPAGDGTWETKCVFTLEEGVEFLGLVVDESR
jgi:hypothetical protein